MNIHNVFPYKPSRVYLSMPPLTACYGKSEAEHAAAIIVWVCQVEGDEWSEFLPLKFMGEVLDKALKSKPVPEPVCWWSTNPFFKPDFELLEKGGYIAKGEALGAKGYVLQEKFFEPLKRWLIK